MTPKPALRPARLRSGDAIGVVSPGAPVAATTPRRLRRGLDELVRRGFRVRVGEHAAARATPEEKLSDLHSMFADDEVRAIICTIGGSDSHQLLDRLDFDLVAARPKLFVGYSDITALHAAIWSLTGLAVVQGPALLPQWGEFGGIDDYSWESWERTLMRSEPAGEVAVSPVWFYERLQYDSEDDRPRRREPNAGPRVVRDGAGEGPIVAAHLSTLLLLAGTEWWPDLAGALLCLEASEDEPGWWVERSLHHLRHLGVWERVAGVAFGRFHPESVIAAELLDRFLLEATRGSDFPIAVDFDFGHTDPMCCLPWGVRARLEGTRLTLIEPAVA
jgi:muramoyltetrapeptide carboxypeptidase